MTAATYPLYETNGDWPGLAPGVSAVGEEAIEVERQFAEVWNSLKSPIIAFPYRYLRSRLSQCQKDARADNWDGYGATAVSDLTLRNALEFLNSLPNSSLPDDVSPEPDGELSFEWYGSPSWVFAVSVGDQRYLSFAGLFGDNKATGVERFTDSVPKEVVRNIRRFRSR